MSKGCHYWIGDENVECCRGFGGDKFVIRFKDGKEVTTTNLWYQGAIPKHFQKILPDNAVMKHF